MPSLRDYRDRIKSVKSTKKITSAMKMVAGTARSMGLVVEGTPPWAEAEATAEEA